MLSHSMPFTNEKINALIAKENGQRLGVNGQGPCLHGDSPSTRGSVLLARDFSRHGDLVFQTCRARLVDAERLLVEIVAGGGIGTRAASHADVAELAAAALAFQVIDIAQLI